ncbi:MAG: carbamoyltransferase [Chitinophagales bacterium]|nr:carbamoyltransferase [Chitinophagales bacterium]
MYILGISAFYHDSAAAILKDGEIIAAAHEERFTRKKHDANFPVQAAKFCLEQCGKTLDDMEAVVFYDKPFLKFERLLETYYGFAPKGVRSFITSMPVWMKEKLFLKKLIFDELKEVGKYDTKKLKLLFPEHHLSHAASAYYPSNYKDAAILTIDGVGEWSTASICHGQENKITILKELHFPHSVGLLYSAFTYYLGFRVNSGEYKLMGLAPYGNPNSERVKKYYNTIVSELADIKDDGSVWLNQKYFNYAVGLTMANDAAWEKLFDLKKREPEAETTQAYCDLGLAIQQVTEDIVIKMARHAKALTGSENLCMAGGVALNCVANGKLLKENIFKNIYIQPAAGDAGGALGAALSGWHIYLDKPRTYSSSYDLMKGAYLGPEYFDHEVEFVTKKYDAPHTYFEDADELCNAVARLMSEGNVVGWVQGKAEWGPRSLGNRSILADPRNTEMQKRLNLKIKYRESFRPFAPAVLEEDVDEYFDLQQQSPYMLLIGEVKKELREHLPSNYHDLPLKEKLYYTRSTLPAITHLDFSARVQTVSKETNPRFHKLITAFKEFTGVGVVVNTSYNVRGEPIVNTPDDAYRCFINTEMDYLVVGNYLFDKTKQPPRKFENTYSAVLD